MTERTPIRVRDLPPADQELCLKAAEPPPGATRLTPNLQLVPRSVPTPSKPGKVYMRVRIWKTLRMAWRFVPKLARSRELIQTVISTLKRSPLSAIPKARPANGTSIITPCGRCRQLIYAAKQVSGEDIRVICCDGTASMCHVYSIDELLPDAFGPADLGIDVRPYRNRRTD
jgi:hypothetical protein